MTASLVSMPKSTNDKIRISIFICKRMNLLRQYPIDFLAYAIKFVGFPE